MNRPLRQFGPPNVSVQPGPHPDYVRGKTSNPAGGRVTSRGSPRGCALTVLGGIVIAILITLIVPPDSGTNKTPPTGQYGATVSSGGGQPLGPTGPWPGGQPLGPVAGCDLRIVAINVSPPPNPAPRGAVLLTRGMPYRFACVIRNVGSVSFNGQIPARVDFAAIPGHSIVTPLVLLPPGATFTIQSATVSFSPGPQHFARFIIDPDLIIPELDERPASNVGTYFFAVP